MAAIFQIRRGSGSVSLVDGELYLHKSSGSLQVGIGTTPITLARLDQPNSGSLRLGGDITASNAYFSGDVAISGNLYLGNQSSDNISALGQFTTNLVPTPTNGIDIGTPSAVWRNVYATSFSGSFSGSINGINEGVSAFSESVDSRLDQLQLASASLQLFTSSQETKNSTLATYTSSVNGRLDRIQESTASLNTFSSSQETKDIVIGAYTASMNTFTSSQETKDIVIGAYTASMNTFTSSTNSRLGDIELYTSSLRTAIDVTGGNTRILGNLIVDGTQTSLNTTETFIEDISITLASGSTTSAIADGAGLNIAGANVSMSWDNTNTRLYFNTNIAALGSISSSTIVGLNGDSVTVYSTSVDSRLSNLQSKSASVDNSISLLGQFTQSQDSKNSTLATYTASVDSDLASIHIVTASLNNFTASIVGINEFTASTKIRLDNLESTSASVNLHIADINTKTGSFETKFTTIGSSTSSLNDFTSSQNTKNLTLENVTSSLNLISASFNSWTGSTYNTFSQSVDSRLDMVEYTVTTLDPGNFGATLLGLNAYTESATIRLNNLESTTSSLNSSISQINSFTASNDNTSLNSYTSSLKGAITINGTDVSIAGGLTVLGTTTIIDTTILAIKDNIIELNAGGGVNGGLVVRDVTGGSTISGSLLWDTTNDRWIAGPLGSEAKVLTDGMGLISGSGQLGNYETTGRGIVSGSSQITFSGISSLPTLVSGSSQINYTGLSGIPGGIVSGSSQTIANLPTGTVSGSSQITYTNISSIPGGIVSGSSQITYASISSIPAGIVSGSSQILGGSTIHSGSSGDYQFNSIGIGTAASGLSGEIRAAHDITAFYSSDIRLKENIQPIQNALEKVESISGNTYDWKEGYDEIHSHKGNDIGVIAQEIEAILPQIVTNRDNGYKAVQYEKIVPLLIEAIKELSAKIKRLENK